MCGTRPSDDLDSAAHSVPLRVRLAVWLPLRMHIVTASAPYGYGFDFHLVLRPPGVGLVVMW